MENHELARAYSWDMGSTLRLVRLEMHMKFQEFNHKILQVVHDHTTDSSYEKFHHELFGRQNEADRRRELARLRPPSPPKEPEIPDDPRLLDQMREKEVDALDVLLPNLSQKMPSHDDAHGQHKKVQFSVNNTSKKTVSLSCHTCVLW